MATTTAHWSLVPCLPTVAEDNSYTSSCALTEGYSDAEHSHWLNPSGVEVTTVHAAGQRKKPNCVIR